MTKIQKALLLLQIFCALILAALPFIDQDRINSYTEDDIRKHLYHMAYDYRFSTTIISALVLAVSSAIKDFFYPRQHNKEIRFKIMDTMIEELFDGDRQHVRITVFKDANVFMHSWIYLRLLIRNIRANHFRLPPRGKYIYVKERRATEYEHSKTFLYYSPETRKKCHGVAGHVRQSLEEIVVKNLPDIEHIDLKDVDMTKRRYADVQKIRKYMENGHLRDLETLKRLNKLARHFYGNILQDSQGTPKGVLVIDSWQDKCPFDDPAVINKLSFYLALFSPTM
jgi:hypothetical protein